MVSSKKQNKTKTYCTRSWKGSRSEGRKKKKNRKVERSVFVCLGMKTNRTNGPLGSTAHMKRAEAQNQPWEKLNS